jgi:hypothetical protein
MDNDNPNKLTNLFIEATSKETDRSLAVIAGCYIDNLLERLLRTFFISDSRVSHLFKSDHILQTYNAKVSIAYFSGLIPKIMFDDLQKIGEIRNKFAHSILDNFDFHNEDIERKIGQCNLRPKTLDNDKANRLKFTIIVTQLGAHLSWLNKLLEIGKYSKLVEDLHMDEFPFENITLTKKEIMKLIKDSLKKR